MFAPEGYVRWDEVLEEIELWAQAVILARVYDANGKDPSIPFEKLPPISSGAMVKAGVAESHIEARFTFDLLQVWMLCQFIEQFEPVLAKPTSETFRCAYPICLHRDRLDWCIWDWPPSQISEFKRYFEYSRAGQFGRAEILARFCVIEPATGIVTQKNGSIEALDIAMHADARRPNEWFDYVRPFLGWSVCWREEVFTYELADFLENAGLIDEALWARGAGQSTLAYSESASEVNAVNVVNCMIESFPDGKGRATWSDVEARVGYSRRTIVRAVKRDARVSNWLSNDN